MRRACARVLLEAPTWTEWVIGFTAAGRQWSEAFAWLDTQRRQYVRDLDRSASYQADLSQASAAFIVSVARSRALVS